MENNVDANVETNVEKNFETNENLFKNSLTHAKKLFDSDPQFSNHYFLSEEQNNILFNAKTCIEILKNICVFFENRPALGFRISETFETISYKKLWEQIEIIATGLHKSGLVRNGDFVGICAFGSLDFALIDFACLYLGAVSVPLQTNMAPNDLKQIINEAGITVLVTSVNQFENATEALVGETTVKNIGIIDLHEIDLNEFLSRNEDKYQKLTLQNPIQIWDIKQIKCAGNEGDLRPMELTESHAIATLVYTSGSTGLPKGAMITHEIWLLAWKESGFSQFPELPFVTLNFMPLNHIMGRYILISALQKGGTVYFTKSETMSTLFEDMRLVRPTILYLVPRISEMIYQHYQLKSLQADKNAEELLTQIGREFLGDRLLIAITAAAPTAPELLSFLKKCFQIPVYNSYGSTEAGIITFDNKIIPSVVSEYKLVSVPELGYFTTDKPYPRGELYVKSAKVISGYYKNPNASKNLFDENGFLKMGDVVEERAPGEVICIDRVKNIQKLANGEYVALARLESIFASESSFIHQIYLYGQSSRAYLLAVVVPNHKTVIAHLNQNNLQINDHEIKKILKEDISKAAQKSKLFSYEIPREFIIENEPFTQKNHLLTESNKYARSNLKTKYSETLESLYAAIEKKQLDDLSKFNNLDASVGNQLQKIKHALITILHIDSEDLFESNSKKFSFKEMGGDSLNAVTWSTIIEQICGLKISVSLILNPVLTLQRILEHVETKLCCGEKSIRYSFESIHGKNPEKLFARDLQIDKFFDSVEIQKALNLKHTLNSRPVKNILLTGANGFLGKFLTFELLSETLNSNGKIYCIVRAENDEKARMRIADVFEQSGAELQERFRSLVQKNLIVLAGDLTIPHFGLSNQIYDKLTSEIDVIVHNGALVNHALSYSELFEANVLGTVEVVRFAITSHLKPINFVSSIAVTSGLKRNLPVSESEDVRMMWPERLNGKGYAEGYATSKWAGEVLLKNAHEAFGLPVNIFRSGMILAHPVYKTELNTADFFTRLMCGVINTGLLPESFYTKSDESNIQPYFDGLPVDFIAKTIAAAAVKAQSGEATYHIVNQEGNAGISFDVIFDWIASAGYKLKKVGSYNEWFQEFEDALKRLTGIQKKQSPLQIINQWQEPISIQNESRLDNTKFRTLALKLNKDPSINKLPNLNKDYIHKYISDMSVLGFIAPPERASGCQ